MKMNLRYVLWIIFGCFSISLGSWFLIFAMNPDKIVWLLGTCSAWTGLILTIGIITGKMIPIEKENITISKSEE